MKTYEQERDAMAEQFENDYINDDTFNGVADALSFKEGAGWATDYWKNKGAGEVERYKKGLVCLVPKKVDANSMLLTCHEKTLCDCQVIKIIDECAATIAALKDSYINDINSIQEKYEDAVDEILKLNAELDQLATNKEALRAEIERLEEGIIEIDSDNQTLCEKLTTCRAALEKIASENAIDIECWSMAQKALEKLNGGAHE